MSSQEAQAGLKPCGCDECGLPYASLRFADLVLPNDVWARISPTGDEGGLLCTNCIIGRLAIEGLSNVPAKFMSGPLACDGEA